jgi:hypothetical protein
MNELEYWKNFHLGTELDISGSFIFNGLKCFHEMDTLYYSDEIFEFLYNISVGLERLFKITITLTEDTTNINQEEFEKSLITHNHLELFNRITNKNKLNIGKIHISFLQVLSSFYKSYRYERYNFKSSKDRKQEKELLHSFIEKNYDLKINDNFPFDITFIDIKLKKFIGKIIGKFTNLLYQIIKDKANELNIYTYELRENTKAFKIFIQEEYDFEKEDILLKELLVYFVNSNNKHTDFLKTIEPLKFNDELNDKYIVGIISSIKRGYEIEEMEELYLDIKKPKERLDILNSLGNYNPCNE